MTNNISIDQRQSYVSKKERLCRKTDNLCAVQLLLGHTKVDGTVRNLGVELEEVLSIAEGIDI